MTTPVTALQDTISALWVAATPPDRATITYHRLGGRAPTSGTVADRAFWWGMPERGEVISESGDAVSQVEWTLTATLRLTSAGRDIETFANAAANETNLLLRLVEQLTVYPSGVLEVFTEPSAAEIDEISGDALVSLSMRALCAETDGN